MKCERKMQKSRMILMADIIGSRTQDQSNLMGDFKEVVTAVMKLNRDRFLSPITITLGDEFQCVVKSLLDSIMVIFEVEERIVRARKKFKLRYVLLEGENATPLNKKIAHGMMGSGLTEAREKLNRLKKNQASRFIVDILDGDTASNLNLAFLVYQSFVDDWSPEKDYAIVSQFLETDDYKLVAEHLDRNRSLMWKRERNLKIRQYKAMKTLIGRFAERIP